jgi:anti-sigma regulatory factor (Ser/Thr protein kinase)
METLINPFIGLGPSGTESSMDDFEITVDVKGTTVTVRRWRR